MSRRSGERPQDGLGRLVENPEQGPGGAGPSPLALLLVADARSTLVVSGNGDVIEPEYDAVAIGSGGGYALAAARGLLANTDLPARAIVEQGLRIAADICIYTNTELTIEELVDAESA